MPRALWSGSIAFGLVSAVVPRADLLQRSKEHLRKVTKNGPVAVRMALGLVIRPGDLYSLEVPN